MSVLMNHSIGGRPRELSAFPNGNSSQMGEVSPGSITASAGLSSLDQAGLSEEALSGGQESAGNGGHGLAGNLWSAFMGGPQTHRPSPKFSSPAQIQAHFQQHHSQALGKLSPKQQKQFMALAGQTQVDGKPSPVMTRLLTSGRLMAKDKGQQTVLDHLNRLSTQRLQKGVDRRGVLLDLSSALADPKRFNQDDQGTCTVTTLGREQARRLPAEFARMNVDLLSDQAQTRGLNGEVIKSVPTDLSKPHRSGRNQVERVYQDAMMDFGNGKHLDYNPETDKHRFNGNPVRGVVGSLRQVVDGRRDGYVANGRAGLTAKEAWDVSRAVLGQNSETRNFRTLGIETPKSRQSFESEFAKYERKEQQMYVALKWSNSGLSGHAVSVARMDKDYVYINNPRGYSEKGKGSGPKREVVEDGGLVRMTRDEFYSRLWTYEALK